MNIVIHHILSTFIHMYYMCPFLLNSQTHNLLISIYLFYLLNSFLSLSCVPFTFHDAICYGGHYKSSYNFIFAGYYGFYISYKDFIFHTQVTCNNPYQWQGYSYGPLGSRSQKQPKSSLFFSPVPTILCKLESLI